MEILIGKVGQSVSVGFVDFVNDISHFMRMSMEVKARLKVNDELVNKRATFIFKIGALMSQKDIYISSISNQLFHC